MKITYLGHSSFLIEGKEKSVVTDPFSDIGYEVERVSADYCTVSHSHFDHSFVSGVNAKKVITQTGDGFLAIKSYWPIYRRTRIPSD
jgi:L-ascorbate metabolism protein UlaG (beta-lactamase superfamily)